MASIRKISGNTVGDNATIIQGDFNATFSTDLKNEDRLFLDKIGKTDPFYDKKRILDIKGPLLQESFEWILDHEHFQKWRNSTKSGAIWIKGDPGKGKTMLLCGIVNDLEQNPGINSNLAYFFCQATDNRINTAAAVVEGLIFSLIERRQKLFERRQRFLRRQQEYLDKHQKDIKRYENLITKHLKPHQEFLSSLRNKFGDKMGQLSGPNAWQILCDIFLAVVQNNALRNVVCVIDGLDECEHDVKPLLNLIVRTSGQVKWLLSSRNVKDIERGLRNIDDSRRLVLELKRNAECVSQSVDTYIDNSIRDIEALEGDEHLQTKTADTLKIKAEGTFLWVSLVVEQLRDTDRRNIEEVLEELPIGLENLYDMIMKRATEKLREKDRNICQILLSVITIAERPLRLEELLEFIKLQCKGYIIEYDMRDMRDIVKDCGSFLSIKDDTVYFVHQSVKDYMVGKGAKSVFPSGIGYQHSEMFKNSLRGMSRILTYNIYNAKAPGTSQYKISPPHPDPLGPISYCCAFWAEHLVQSCQHEKTNVEEFLKDDGILYCFLKDKFLCWLESLALLKAFNQGIDAIDKVKNIISRRCECQDSQYDIGEMTCAHGKNRLKVFIDDAWKFISNCEKYVRDFPLQLYYTPFVFGDNNNTINKTFQQAVYVKFGDLPTFINMPPRRFSCMQVLRPKTSLKSLLFSPNSSLLCITHKNGAMSLWRTASGTLEREIELNVDVKGMRIDPQLGTNHHIAFSSDPNQLVSVSSEGVVQTWSIDNEMQVQRHRLKLIDGTERVIALSQNGDLAASVQTSGVGQLIVWTTKTGDQLQSIRLENISNLFSAIFSPNSTLIALIDKSGVTIYSVQTGLDIQHLQRPLALWDSQRYEYKTLSKFSPNSEIFAYVYDSRNIDLWCTNTWTIMQRIKLENFTYYDNIDQFAFSPNSATFIIGAIDTLHFGRTTTGQYQRYILPEATEDITFFSPSWSWTKSSWFLAAETDGRVEIWVVNTADASVEAHNTDFLSGGTTYISPDSKLIAALDYWNRDINIFAADSGEIVRVLERKKSFWSKLAFSPSSYFLAGQVDGTDDIHIWDVNTGTVIQELQGPGYSRTAIAFSHDSKHLVTCYDNVAGYYKDYSKGLVRIWHVESGHNLYEFGREVSEYGMCAVAISTDLKLVAICDLDYVVQLWEPRAGHCVHKFIQWDAINLTFSSDSAILAVTSWGSEKDEVQILDTATGICLFQIDTQVGDRVAFFDPANGDILTDRFIFKNSSWKHWHKFPRQGYSHNGVWICLGGQETLLIPYEFRHGSMGRPVLSESLVAFTSIADQVIIVKFPYCGDLKRQETKMLDAYNTSHPDLNLDITSNIDAGYLVDENSNPNAAKKRKKG
ncbi:hypothetical protein GGI43DRAFT_415250 [Trichoderma evansii]